LGVLALLLVVGVGVFIYLISPRSNNQQQAALPVIESRSGDPRVEAKVLEIASKFICSCGACGEKPLDTCACPKAAEERQFIRNSLQVGQTQEQVIAAVKATYGWMKPEFAAKDDSNAAVAAKLKPPVIAKQTDAVLTKLASKVGSNARLVTVADRVEVFSHFKCPCGQCGVEELKDCGCSHPRGATEVKAFVDQKIAEGKYALSQVIDLVDKQYGGRKF
jgi:cytochrome c-type biogenesis protein CcmH/NrfF